MLRKQLGGIEIRKRRHDEVDPKLARGIIVDRLVSLGFTTRELEATGRPLERAPGVKVVKNEDDEEKARRKRIKNETA